MANKTKSIFKKIGSAIAVIAVILAAVLLDRSADFSNAPILTILLFDLFVAIILSIPIFLTFYLLKSAKKQSHGKLTKKDQIKAFCLLILPVICVFVSSNLPRLIVKDPYIPGGDVILTGLDQYLTIRLWGYILAFMASVAAVVFFIRKIFQKTAGKIFWWFAAALSVIFAIMVGTSLTRLTLDQSFESAKLLGYWQLAVPIYASFPVAAIIDRILTSRKK